MLLEKFARNEFLVAVTGRFGARVRGTVFAVQSLVHLERDGLAESGAAHIATECHRWHAKVIDVRPFLFEASFAQHTLRAMFPEEMTRDVGLVAIRNVAAIAQMMQFMFPHVTRQAALIEALFQAHVAR